MENIREILGDATMAYTNTYIKDKEKIVKSIFNILKDAKEEIEKAIKIDIKNKNGFEVDFEKLQKLHKIEKYIKIIKPANKLGTVCVVYDGNPYIMIEMIVKAIITNNAIILANETEQMQATNKLMLVLIQRVLEANKIDKNLVQSIEAKDIEEILTNTASIKKVIVIGNKTLQEKIKDISKISVATSGYGNFDIYVEESKVLKGIDERNTNIYVKKGLEVPFKKYVEVQDIDEAIGLINYNTSGYSSSIYSSNPKNKENFTKEVKTSYVSMDKSPVVDTIESDVHITEFLMKKQILRNGKSNEKILESSVKKQEEYKQEEKIEEIKPIEISLEGKKEMSNSSLVKKDEAIMIEEDDTLEDMKKEIEALQEENKRKNLRMQQKDEQISELTKQLHESQTIAKKYMSILEKSFIVRLFGNLKKSDINRDKNLLS